MAKLFIAVACLAISVSFVSSFPAISNGGPSLLAVESLVKQELVGNEPTFTLGDLLYYLLLKRAQAIADLMRTTTPVEPKAAPAVKEAEKEVEGDGESVPQEVESTTKHSSGSSSDSAKKSSKKHHHHGSSSEEDVDRR